jgi:hypothetical protein
MSVKILRERASASDAASGEAQVLSYYRRYARDCDIAAKSAPNEKQRLALQKMLPAWNDFAELHERTIHESTKDCASAVRHPPIKGWM